VAGKQKYGFGVRVSAEHPIHPEPVLRCSGNNFHVPKLMFGAIVPDNCSLSNKHAQNTKLS